MSQSCKQGTITTLEVTYRKMIPRAPGFLLLSRQTLMEEQFEDTKWAIRIRKSKKDRHHNGQKKKDKHFTEN